MKTRRALIFCAILMASIGCDHATKQIARSALKTPTSISLGGDTVRFELVANRGAFLGLGAHLPSRLRDVTFLVLVPLALALVCATTLRSGSVSRHQLVGLALVAGGGAANWLDRLFHSGTVTDFVSLGLGGVRTGIFNLADIAIILGVALLIVRRKRDTATA